MSQIILVDQASAVSAPASGQLALFSNNDTFSKLNSKDDASHANQFCDYVQDNSILAVAGGYAADTYLAGSLCKIPIPGDWRAGAKYRCKFDMTKAAAGVAAPTIIVRMGTLGNISDAAILTLTLGIGTAAVDTGIFELLVNFRSVGSGTAAVIQAILTLLHQAATGTGLTSTADKSLTPFAPATSAGFNSSLAQFIGLSFNGGSLFSGTNTLVQAIFNNA